MLNAEVVNGEKELAARHSGAFLFPLRALVVANTRASTRTHLCLTFPHSFEESLRISRFLHCVGEARARDFVSQKLAEEDTARISELRRVVMITSILATLAIVAIRLAGATVNEAVLGTVAEGRNRICGLHIDTKGELQC